MSRPAQTVRALLASLCLAACSSSEPSAPSHPPPLPAAPLPSAPAPAEPVPSEPVPAEPTEPSAAPHAGHHGDEAEAAEDHEASEGDKANTAKGDAKGLSLYDLEKQGKVVPRPTPQPATPPATKPPSSTVKPPITPPVVAPAPVATPKPAAPKGGKVVIPSTKNVSVEVPRGLQAALDADPRMQGWVNQVVQTADSCYAAARRENPAAEGVIEVRVVLHENERPDGDIKKAPSALSSVLTCGTSKLMRVKMPLFTGPEGQAHTVKLHFVK